MKRRGFLGFMGGAAVAGPAVAKNVVAEMPKGLFGGGMAHLGGAPGHPQPTSVSGSSGWRQNEIASLRRFLTGELSDEEKEDRRRQRLYSRQSRISHDIASLVSVSGAYKLAMFEDRMERHNDEISKSSARGRLAWLLTQKD